MINFFQFTKRYVLFPALDCKLVSKLISNLTIFYKLYVVCVKQFDL